MARQAILTKDEKVFGYELLFRNGVESYFCAPDSEIASRSTLDTSMLLGLDVLCDGRRAFINCTRDTLLNDAIGHPGGDTVLRRIGELLVAGVRDSDEVCRWAGDEFVILFPETTAEQRGVMLKRIGPWRCRMLAEKVETREDFHSARNSGFVYFQGFFFRRPELMQTHEIPANRLNYMRMLQAVSQPELDSRGIENAIKSEASLCYRLLRYLNSATFGFATEIHSVRHALAMLGEREVRRWVRLVATLAAGQDKPSDLILSALVRARFCETLSSKIQHGGSDLFLLGLISAMDSILGIPMSDVLENVPLDQETAAVLRGGASPLRPLYQLMLAQESGNWESVPALARQLSLDETEVAAASAEAMQWAREVTSS